MYHSSTHCMHAILHKKMYAQCLSVSLKYNILAVECSSLVLNCWTVLTSQILKTGCSLYKYSSAAKESLTCKFWKNTRFKLVVLFVCLTYCTRNAVLVFWNWIDSVAKHAVHQIILTWDPVFLKSSMLECTYGDQSYVIYMYMVCIFCPN